MRKRVKKALALLLMAAFLMSAVNENSLLALAEEAESLETSLPEEESTEEITGDEEEKRGEGEAVSEEETSNDGETAEDQAEQNKTAEAQGTEGQPAKETEQTEQAEQTEQTEQVEYVPAEQPEGIDVKAYAAEGTLPEDAEMTAVVLTAENEATAEEYQEAKSALEESGLSYDGFLVFDIGFRNADGEEIEPQEGTVQVQFQLDAALFPEEADLSTLAVQHVAETEEGLQVETVADMAENTEGTMQLDAEETVIAAEFKLESFSAIPITYAKKPGGNPLEGGSTASSNLEVVKKWVTTSGTTVTDSNSIPFGKVEVDIQQFYKVTVGSSLQEKIINTDTLTLVSAEGWKDTYNGKIEDYSVFRATAERVYDKNGPLMVTYTYDVNAGTWSPTYADSYTEGDLKGWTIGEFQFSRNYEGAEVSLTTIHEKNKAVFDVSGGGLVVLKKGGSYAIWMPYLDMLEGNTTAREAIRTAVEKAIGKSAQFLDEMSGESLAATEIIYNEDGTVHLDFTGGGQDSWSWFSYGPFQFTSNVISCDLVNKLDTTSEKEIEITKIWEGDEPDTRPDSVVINVKGTPGTYEYAVTVSNTDKLLSDQNKWVKKVSVPRYDSAGNAIVYTIKEDVSLTDYTPTYDQTNLTVTNRPTEKALTVTKTVAGDMGDRNHEFTFTLTLTKNSAAYTEALTYVKNRGTAQSLNAENGMYEFKLKHGDTITFTIPYGCAYTLEESKEDYQVEIDGTSDPDAKTEGTLKQDVTISYKNTRNMVPPTGIAVDVAPYLLIVLFAFGCALLWVFGRCRRV